MEEKARGTGCRQCRKVAYWRGEEINIWGIAGGTVDLAAWLTSLEDEGRVTDVVTVNVSARAAIVVARVEPYAQEGEAGG